ncbi:MAG: ATP-binding cassette domain-containing protein [Propionibacteriales bacterium]|nr:ATP-binding cassette domain-containing protein [Propionibacteriales bacterium]
MSSHEPALEFKDIVKRYRQRGVTGTRDVRAVNGVTLTVHPRQTVALVGESGCGKSTLAKVAVALEAPTEGAVRVLGHDMSAMKGSALRKHRRTVSMVFQDPASSLNPRWKVLDVVSEPLRVQFGGSSKKYRSKVVELLLEVGLDEGYLTRRSDELSGGQRQRVGIARALALDPKVIVLDEAVSALDVSVQAQVLNLLNRIKELHGLSYLFISHDLSVVRHVSDYLAVMYLGQVVEEGPAENVFDDPQHPYTLALLNAIPPDTPTAPRPARVAVRGELPDPANPPPGCPFASRCWKVQDLCREERPDLAHVRGQSRVACHFPNTDEGDMS